MEEDVDVDVGEVIGNVRVVSEAAEDLDPLDPFVGGEELQRPLRQRAAPIVRRRHASGSRRRARTSSQIPPKNRTQVRQMKTSTTIPVTARVLHQGRDRPERTPGVGEGADRVFGRGVRPELDVRRPPRIGDLLREAFGDLDHLPRSHT